MAYPDIVLSGIICTSVNAIERQFCRSRNSVNLHELVVQDFVRSQFFCTISYNHRAMAYPTLAIFLKSLHSHRAMAYPVFNTHFIKNPLRQLYDN